ncbi:MAG: hypothetical protein ACP5DX_08350 [Paracoccaceae bacterium]|jgi:hypothetical protein
MQFPDSVRADLLEFLGATPVEDAQLKQMIADVAARLDESPQTRINHRLSA